MNQFHEHEIEVTHRRDLAAVTADQAPVNSNTYASASSTNLVEAWRECLSRLPNDTYAALKEAMKGVDL